MKRRVVITGMGWITPLGHDIESAWKRLLAGESGVAPTTNFDARTYPTTFSAEVKGFDLARALGPDYDTHMTASRQATFAIAAADQAWKASGSITVGACGAAARAASDNCSARVAS